MPSEPFRDPTLPASLQPAEKLSGPPASRCLPVRMSETRLVFYSSSPRNLSKAPPPHGRRRCCRADCCIGPEITDLFDRRVKNEQKMFQITCIAWNLLVQSPLVMRS